MSNTFEISKSQGILLDIGCGENKQPNFVGMDKRDLPGVDIVHDVEIFPWPLEDESCLTAMCSHLIEHIKPWLAIDFMNEIWRVMKVGSQLIISAPYGVSEGFVQDPSHVNPVNQVTFQYFDPSYPLYGIYKPQPWKIEKGWPIYQVSGNLEIMMRKMTVKEMERILKGSKDG